MFEVRRMRKRLAKRPREIPWRVSSDRAVSHQIFTIHCIWDGTARWPAAQLLGVDKSMWEFWLCSLLLEWYITMPSLWGVCVFHVENGHRIVFAPHGYLKYWMISLISFCVHGKQKFSWHVNCIVTNTRCKLFDIMCSFIGKCSKRISGDVRRSLMTLSL